MIVLFKKDCIHIKRVFIRITTTLVLFLSLFLILISSSYSSSFLDQDMKVSLDLNALDKNSIPSEDFSNFFDISKPFIIKDSYLNKGINQDLDTLNEFYKHRHYLNDYQEYPEIRNYSLEILQYYFNKLILHSPFSNQSSNLFIGIGSSPTPIMSFWENLKNLDTFHYTFQDPIKLYLNSSEFLTVPFSKNIIPEYSFYSLQQQQQPVYKERYLKLFKLLDLYTKDVSFSNKNIIILDFAVSGMSIAIFARLFLKYLEYKNINIKSIHLHLITTLTPTDFIIKLNTLDNVFADNISKKYSILSFKLYDSKYDKYAKYPLYLNNYMNQKFSDPVTESNFHKQYKLSMRKLMQNDKEIILRSCPLLFSILSRFN